MKPGRFFLALTCGGSLWGAAAQAICILPCNCMPCPVIHAWPTDPPPCDTFSTLQACVDSANSGDEVLIESDGPINESISFQKSLSLRAAQNFAPVFGGNQHIVGQSPASGTSLIDIEGLTLQQGSIEIEQESTDTLTAKVVGNTIESSLVGDAPIEVFATGSGLGAIDFNFSGNVVAVTSPTSTGIVFDSKDGDATGLVANNSILVENSQANGGIILTSRAASSSFDVIANRVTGTGYGYGIVVSPYGASALMKARLLDNLLTGQSSASVTPKGGVVLNPYFTGGTLVAFVVNNTLDGDQDGIVATMSGQSGATISGLVANNIVSHSSEAGITIDSAFAATTPNQSNLVFANATDFVGTTAGPGTVSLNPLFVAASDYHLEPGSPAIDTGNDAAVPADLTTDLDGNPRIQGSHVDIGAYETAPEPTAEMLSFTALAALFGLRLAAASLRS